MPVSFSSFRPQQYQANHPPKAPTAPKFKSAYRFEFVLEDGSVTHPSYPGGLENHMKAMYNRIWTVRKNAQDDPDKGSRFVYLKGEGFEKGHYIGFSGDEYHEMQKYLAEEIWDRKKVEFDPNHFDMWNFAWSPEKPYLKPAVEKFLNARDLTIETLAKQTIKLKAPKVEED